MALELYRKKQQEVQTAKDLDQDTKSLSKTQTKILAANQSGIATIMTFNNLIIGEWYEVWGQTRGSAPTAGSLWNSLVHNGVTLSAVAYTERGSLTVPTLSLPKAIFQATATTVTFENLSGNTVEGDATRLKTWISLEHLPNHEETTQWT